MISHKCLVTFWHSEGRSGKKLGRLRFFDNPSRGPGGWIYKARIGTHSVRVSVPDATYILLVADAGMKPTVLLTVSDRIATIADRKFRSGQLKRALIEILPSDL